MTNQFPYHAIAMFLFGIILDGKANITHPVSGHRFLNAFKKRFLGHLDEFHYFFSGITNGKGVGMITMPAIQDHAYIHGDDIPFF